MKSLIILLLRFIRIFVDFLSDIIYGIIYEGGSSIKIAPIRNQLLLNSATVLAEKIRNGQITSRQVVEAYINRIQEVNGVINGVVDTRFEEALCEADDADLEIETSPDLFSLARDRPFLGVPFTTKDCFGVRGLSLTAGLLARGQRRAKADFNAETVQLMINAGAIPLAVTNVSELCMWMESSNKVYGRTNNPYHVGRIVGGSSGGEAATIASAASPFGIGSDVGGSIRMPSFFCGIFGHKPTEGVVSNQGQLPVAYGVVDHFLVTGPMCRYASDLLPMFKVLLKQDVIQSDLLKLDQQVDLKKLKVYYMVDDTGNPVVSPVHSDLKRAQMKVVERLHETLGIEATKVNLKKFFNSALMWSHKMSSEPSAPSFAQELAECEGEINPYIELFKWFCMKQTAHTFPAIGLALFEKFVSDSDPMHQKFLDMADELAQELDLLLGDDGILLYPSHSTPAPFHGQPIIKTFNFSYTAIFNVLGNPVTQVPLGLGSWGVPLGIQMVAGKNMDRNSLAMAVEIEKLFGGWIPPTAIL